MDNTEFIVKNNYHWRTICKNYEEIEGFEQMIQNPNETYVIHHRLETDYNISAEELISKGLYYNRPANELLIMTQVEHGRLHGLHRKGQNFSGPMTIVCIQNKTIFHSQSEAARLLGLTKQDISQQLKGKKKHVKKYVFEIYDQEIHTAENGYNYISSSTMLF